MKVCVVLVATALLAFGTVSQAVADDVAVIVNKSNPVEGLTMADLRRVLLGPRPKWSGGTKVTVMMTQAGQPERTGTIKIVCGMSETDFNLHFWRTVSADGANGPPKVFTSAVQLRQSVAGAPDAVGFIKASEVDDSVKVVAIDGNLPGQPAYKLKLK